MRLLAKYRFRQVRRPSPPRIEPEMALGVAAERLDLSPEKLKQIAKQWFVEPTYSIDQVAAHLGCSKATVNKLVRYGLWFGEKLHSQRGGLYPTFKAFGYSRRIPLSAIEHHKAHLARVHGNVVEAVK